MRRIEEVIAHLEELGYRVIPEDGMLRIKHPKPRPEEGPELVNTLKGRKDEALRALTIRPPRPPAPDTVDPRPDLWQDHRAWESLLTRARQEHPGLLPLLKGLRAGGSRLVDRQTSFFLDTAPSASADLPLETIRHKWLAPHTEQLRSLLKATHQSLFGTESRRIS